MFVATARVELFIAEAQSLKDKRKVVKGLVERVRGKYNASVSEVGGQDLWQRAEIGVAVVSNEKKHAESMLTEIVRYIEYSGVEISNVVVEVF